MRRHSFVFAAMLALAFASAAPGARTQPADPQATIAAQALYDAAVKAMDAKDYATACPKLEEVVRLIPEGVGAKLSLAECYEGADRLASAWSEYKQAEAAAARSGQRERERLAHRRAEALHPRLATLTVVVPEAVRRLPGLVITRDGLEVGPVQWDVAIPVDKGEHRVVIVAEGKPLIERVVEIAANGAAASLDVGGALEEAAPKARPAAPAPKPRAAALPVTPEEAPPTGGMHWTPQRVIGLAVGAAGLASAGVGSIFGAIAIEKKNASNEGHCDEQSRCDPVGLELREEGLQAGTASTILFIAGGVALAGGVTLFLTAPAEPEAPRAGLLLGPGRVGISGAW